MPAERLQKIIAAAGIASRRKAEELITSGRVVVNGQVVTALGSKADLEHGLMKAASHVPKTYVVKVSGKPAEEQLARLRQGLSIGTDEQKRVKTAPAKIRLIRDAPNPWYEITLIEGRNRQIRRMFEEIGHHVEKIRRVRYGPLALDVEPGRFRPLTLQEVAQLKSAAQPRSPM